MNIQQYIDSGVIEDYCLGLLSNAERAKVVQNAAQYEEIRTTINEYEQMLKRYAEDWVMPDDAVQE